MALCHFFVVPQRNGERTGARTFPPRPPSEREKSFRCRLTQFFAKVSIFSLCVCKLKKPDFGKPKSQVCLFAVANIVLRTGANIAANTEVARKQNSKRFFHPSSHPVQLNSKQNDFAFFACRSWWQNLKHGIKEFYVYLLIRFEERHGHGSSKRERLG